MFKYFRLGNNLVPVIDFFNAHCVVSVFVSGVRGISGVVQGPKT